MNILVVAIIVLMCIVAYFSLYITLESFMIDGRIIYMYKVIEIASGILLAFFILFLFVVDMNALLSY